MKILKEITEWNSETRVPNHIYFVSDNKEKVFAYVKESGGDVFQFKAPYKFNTRYRKFKEIANTFGFEVKEEVQKEIGQTWSVKGSKGDTHTVSLVDNEYACTCSGFKFRGKCRHIDSVKA